MGWDGPHSRSGGHRQKRVAPIPRLVASNVVIESAFPNLIWPSEPFVMGGKCRRYELQSKLDFPTSFVRYDLSICETKIKF